MSRATYSVLCRASSTTKGGLGPRPRMPPRPVFQLVAMPRTMAPASLFDVDDALSVVLRMPKYQHRVDYCASVGIDYDRVVQYYQIVCQLEHLYRSVKAVKGVRGNKEP